MAMGKALLVPDLLPLRDVIRQEVNGILFDPADRNDFQARLDSLIKNPQLRRNLGLQARQSVIEKHTWKHNAALIIKVMGGSPAPD